MTIVSHDTTIFNLPGDGQMLRLRLKPKPPFSPVHTKKERFKTVRFQKTPLLKPLSKFPVCIKVFGRLSMDDRRKYIKKYAFSNKNAVV